MRAVIAEDQALLRAGLVLVVESAGFEIAGTAEDGRSLLEITRTEKPDLVVTDIRMPPTFTDEGLVAALEIRRTQPSTAVLVLSQFVQRRYALELVRQRGGPVVGIHLVGARVGELIGEAQLVTSWDAFPSDVAGQLHAHPTQSEALGEAHLALAGKPLHTHG